MHLLLVVTVTPYKLQETFIYFSVYPKRYLFLYKVELIHTAAILL